MTDPGLINAQVWRDLYRSGRGDLRYPNDVLVRLGARLLDARRSEDWLKSHPAIRDERHQ